MGLGAATRPGATPLPSGVNFAVESAVADRVELCLYDPRSGLLRASTALRGRTGDVWHGFVPAPLAGAGDLYAYRVHGPYDPARGLRCNPAKLLLDPRARALTGEPRLDASLLDGPDEHDLDSAAAMPRCRIVDPSPDWGRDRAPGTPWKDTVIYELHVKGFTMLHPLVPKALRGKYLGLAEPAVIDWLRRLGVTAVELMPCQSFTSEAFLQSRGLVNYWGYNSLAWSAPATQYALVDAVTEFQQMVSALHAGGIEVILDVVFNHTAEGNEFGPTLSLRGVDNAAYYRLDAKDRRRYDNLTGCGNTIDASSPAARSLIVDSLRWWAEQMHVDGFRFDLATVLGRADGGYDPAAPIFAAIRAEPSLAFAKLIAEPWDVGPGGYRLGQFPPGWSEWNDKYRDTVRRYWRGEGLVLGELAERIAGSSDLFRSRGRKPSASINFVTSHDGFTLADLVSYNGRHNDANLEDNRDGHEHNLSWNCGVEGPSDDPDVSGLRQRQMRNFLLTLLFSQGVPMLQAGDELARTQQGNNNAYCQDNAISWVDWSGIDAGSGQVDFVRRLIALRRDYPELRRETFLKGGLREGVAADITWLNPRGLPMTEADWRDPQGRTLGVLLATSDRARGWLYALLNASDDWIEYTLPESAGEGWQVIADTADPAHEGPVPAGAPRWVRPKSALVFKRVAAVFG